MSSFASLRSRLGAVSSSIVMTLAGVGLLGVAGYTYMNGGGSCGAGTCAHAEHKQVDVSDQAAKSDSCCPLGAAAGATAAADMPQGKICPVTGEVAAEDHDHAQAMVVPALADAQATGECSSSKEECDSAKECDSKKECDSAKECDTKKECDSGKECDSKKECDADASEQQATGDAESTHAESSTCFCGDSCACTVACNGTCPGKKDNDKKDDSKALA